MRRKYIPRQSHAARVLHFHQPWPKTCHCRRTIIYELSCFFYLISTYHPNLHCLYVHSHSRTPHTHTPTHTHTHTHTQPVVIIRWSPGFDLRSVRGGFLVDWTAMGQNFLRILPFPLASFPSTSSPYTDSFVYSRCCTVQLLTNDIWKYWCVCVCVCMYVFVCVSRNVRPGSLTVDL